MLELQNASRIFNSLTYYGIMHKNLAEHCGVSKALVNYWKKTNRIPKARQASVLSFFTEKGIILR